MSAKTTITATVTGELSGSVSVDLFSEYRNTLKINDADGLAAVVFLGVRPGSEDWVTRNPADPSVSDGECYVDDSVRVRTRSGYNRGGVLLRAYVRFPYVLCEAGGLIGYRWSAGSSRLSSGFYDQADKTIFTSFTSPEASYTSDSSVANQRMPTISDNCAESCRQWGPWRYAHYVYKNQGEARYEYEYFEGANNFRIKVGRAVHPDLPYLVKGYPEAGGVCTLVATASRYGRLINGHRLTDEEFMHYFSSDFLIVREALEADPDYFPN